MKKNILLLVALCLSLVFSVAYFAMNQYSNQSTTATQKNSLKEDTWQVWHETTPLEEAGTIAHIISQYSSTLSEEVKLIISQDYYGAPLSTPPQRHVILAQLIACNRSFDASTEPACTIIYGKETSTLVNTKDASDLFEAFVRAGVQSVRSQMREYIEINNLVCMVDDAQVQSSGGASIQGFSCSFKAGVSKYQMQENIRKEKEICMFNYEDKNYEVHPCRVHTTTDGVITVGVAQKEGDVMANPFFYFYKSEVPSEWSAFWNGGNAESVKADRPLPGAWWEEDGCYMSYEWRLCF